ncbi:hypothetical protein MBLNU230_g3464t1 [Neophaeotheca triangularis]
MNTAADEEPEVRAADLHEDEVETREAYEYWGYLFKADKTGTDKLKSLLRGLKNKVNEQYERSDNPDLTPTQLGHFYRELGGNYDQLFLGTPSTAIAFIYKSLGCLHSLQPQPHSTFTEPTIPALKTEGWIMWQTIQILLGPEEHATFLREAVRRWDIKDPRTGEVFPKLLPRESFPAEPDKHMVAWYEGVSERLRKEAEEEEEKQRQIDQADAEHDKLRIRTEEADDDDSHDSRAALAYFRNPLYRHVDGRPSIVRKTSKRPNLSPRQTVMDKGKHAATTVGHVVRNIASPSLWDGGHSSSGSRDRDRDKRRRSLPHHYPGETPPTDYFDRQSSRHHSHHHSRRPSTAQAESPRAGTPPIVSPRPRYDRHYDPHLRPSKSHEPAPSPGEYFPPFSASPQPHDSRRNSAHEPSPDPAMNQDANFQQPSPGLGPSFGPSQSPLFASHIARQPQPTIPNSNPYNSPPQQPQPRRSERDNDRDRRRESRHDSEPPRDRRKFHSPDRRSRSRHSRPHSRHYPENLEPEDPPRRHTSHRHHPSTSNRRSGSDVSANHPQAPGGHSWPRDDYETDATTGSGPEGRDSKEGRRGTRPKVTRFVTPVKGVHGRSYPVA